MSGLANPLVESLCFPMRTLTPCGYAAVGAAPDLFASSGEAAGKIGDDGKPEAFRKGGGKAEGGDEQEI
jgi:hypothetical protein